MFRWGAFQPGHRRCSPIQRECSPGRVCGSTRRRAYWYLEPSSRYLPPPLLVFDDVGEDEFPRLVVFDDVRYFRRPPLLGGGVVQADNQVRLLRVKTDLVRHENDRKSGGLGRPPERLDDQSPTVRLRLEDVLDPLAGMRRRREALDECIERLVSLGRVYSRKSHHEGQFG